MAKHYITQVPGTPVPPSPISQAVVVGNTCHISGQLATYNDGYRPGSALEEAERAFELLFRIVEHAGFERSDIVYVDIAFVNMTRDVAAVNALYGALFADPPARTIYQAAALPYGAKIKVQAVAMRDCPPPPPFPPVQRAKEKGPARKPVPCFFLAKILNPTPQNGAAALI